MNGPTTQDQLRFLHELYNRTGVSPALRLMILALAESVKAAEELRDFRAAESLREKTAAPCATISP